MNDILKIEDVVKEVLMNDQSSRNDDFILVYRVYCEMYPGLDSDHTNNFRWIMLNHKQLDLPSWASISRIRRKVFKQYPEIKPEKMTEIREEQEEEFKEYART